MSTVREKIINALTLFYTAIKSKFVLVGNVVNNCASTSTTYPLAANQGTQLQNQIDELNSNLAKVPQIVIGDVYADTTIYFISSDLIFTDGIAEIPSTLNIYGILAYTNNFSGINITAIFDKTRNVIKFTAKWSSTETAVSGGLNVCYIIFAERA